MKKVITIIIVLLMVLGSGLLIGKAFFEQKTTKSTLIRNSNKKLVPKLWSEIEILDPEQEVTKYSAPNQIFQGELIFENANSEKTYIVKTKLISKEGNRFIGPDKKPLEVNKEIVLGKQQGKINILLKGNKPMLVHIGKLKDVQVSSELKEKE